MRVDDVWNWLVIESNDGRTRLLLSEELVNSLGSV
jgi:hypothetical protein